MQTFLIVFALPIIAALAVHIGCEAFERRAAIAAWFRRNSAELSFAGLAAVCVSLIALFYGA